MFFFSIIIALQAANLVIFQLDPYKIMLPMFPLHVPILYVIILTSITPYRNCIKAWSRKVLGIFSRNSNSVIVI